MFKLASGLFLVGVILVPFSGINRDQSGSLAATSQDQLIYRIVANSGDYCIMMLHKNSASQRLMASPQADCASLDSRVDVIRKWEANGDGTVSLLDFADREILRLENVGRDSFKSTGQDDLRLSFHREK